MADKLKNIAKGGWHPEKNRAAKDGGHSEGGRLGQVKGMLGRGGGKGSDIEAARNHQSAPLSSLTDPSKFAPPPKRLDYSANATASRAAPVVAEEKANRPPPGPYKPDTTGLSTSHLPKPPAFRPGTASPLPNTATKPKPKPSLPPRLPPRQNSNPNEYAPTPPPTYNEATQGTPSQGVLNQGALNRLGQAGISVPGFGESRTASPPVPARQTNLRPVPARQTSASGHGPPPPPAPRGHASQLGELQSRFGNMSTGKTSSEAPATGTSWADKQAALRTAGGLRDDPSKVSGADMRNAASTANNFQQRHGAQVASGFKAANGLNQKYGIAGRFNHLGSSSAASPPPPAQSPVQSSSGGAGRKLAPPPPPKKKELAGSSGEPPPIPLSSKPKF